MNFERIYQYRFRDINIRKKQNVWYEISKFIDQKLNYPEKVLDPSAGYCEFINSSRAQEKWAVDISEEINKYANESIHTLVGNILNVDLPEEYFTGILSSNFLEHLPSKESIAKFLEKMFQVLKREGRIVVIGPNFRLCSDKYYDFADHNLALTEESVAEHLYGAGFNIQEVQRYFLPYSFRSRLPTHRLLVRLYLKFPLIWRVLGKQYLVVGYKK